MKIFIIGEDYGGNSAEEVKEWSCFITAKTWWRRLSFFFFRSDLRWEVNEFFLSLFLFSSLFEWLLFSILSNDLIKWGKGRVRVWWLAAMEAWFDRRRQWRHKEKGERWEWEQRQGESQVRVKAKTRREKKLLKY